MLRPWAIRIRLRLPSAGRAYGGLLSGAQGLPAGAWSDRLSPTPALSRHALHRLRDLAGMHDMNALDDWFGLCCAGTPAQNARSRDRARRGPPRPHRRRPVRRQLRARAGRPFGSWRPGLRLDGGAALSQRPVPGQAARHCPALPQGGRVKRYAGRSIALQGDTLRLPGYLGGPRADGAGPRSLEFRGRGRSGSLRRIVTPTIACTPWSSAWGDLPPSTQRGHRDTSGGSRSRAHESAGRRCRTASSGRRGNRPRSVVRDRRR